MESIENFIKMCAFDENDIEDATCGLCGSFALMLYDYLANDFPSLEFVVAKYWGGWRHIFLRHEGLMYDVNGLIDEKSLHNNFCTNSITSVTKEWVIKELDFYYKEMEYTEWAKDSEAAWRLKIQKQLGV